MNRRSFIRTAMAASAAALVPATVEAAPDMEYFTRKLYTAMGIPVDYVPLVIREKLGETRINPAAVTRINFKNEEI